MTTPDLRTTHNCKSLTEHDDQIIHYYLIRDSLLFHSILAADGLLTIMEEVQMVAMFIYLLEPRLVCSE